MNILQSHSIVAIEASNHYEYKHRQTIETFHHDVTVYMKQLHNMSSLIGSGNSEATKYAKIDRRTLLYSRLLSGVRIYNTNSLFVAEPE